MSLLPDGRYDAFILDATPEPGTTGTLSLDLAITTGPHKGEVVAVHAAGLGRSDTDLLGLPATLTVAGGQPSVVLDD